MVLLVREERSLARPPCDRSPDEALHAVPSDRQRGRSGRQGVVQPRHRPSPCTGSVPVLGQEGGPHPPASRSAGRPLRDRDPADRSEDHTSELQYIMPILYAVFCLKKNTQDYIQTNALYTS